MNKRLMFSHEEWTIYESMDDGKLVAVPKKEMPRIFHLISHYGNLNQIHVDEKVVVVPVENSPEKVNELVLSDTGHFQIPLCKLKSTLISIAQN